jgi:hypothetical protein
MWPQRVGEPIPTAFARTDTLLLEVLRGQRSLPIAQLPTSQQPQLAALSKPQIVAPLSAPTTGDEVAELKRQLEAPSEPTAPKK